MAAAIKTPGVYIVEKNAFPNSVVEVATAVPAFIGYTQKRPVPADKIVPTRISSLAEYEKTFGGAPKTQFTFTAPRTVQAQDASRFLLYSSMRLFFDNGGGPCWIVSIGTYDSAVKDGGGSKFTAALKPLEKILEPTMLVAPDAVLLSAADWQNVCQQFLMHCGTMQNRVSILDVFNGDKERNYQDDDVIQSFRNAITSDFLNYGQTYYPWVNTSIVEESDVDYSALQADSLTTLQTELKKPLSNVDDPAKTAISNLIDQMPSAAARQAVLGEAARLDEPARGLVSTAADQWNKQPTDDNKKKLTDEVGKLPDDNPQKKKITDLIAKGDPSPLAVARRAVLDEAAKLDEPAKGLVSTAADNWNKQPTDENKKKLTDEVNKLPDPQKGKILELINKGAPPAPATSQPPAPVPNLTQVHRSLRAVSPIYVDVMSEIQKKLNVLPPSGGMAGVYTRVDNSIGVFKAPANTGISSVISPVLDLTSADQEDLNVPLDGKAVNAIRAFPGRGVLIWGARTLDGNSQDWRYINVRRTIIMLEQSIKFGCLAYVFEPNSAPTWVTVKNMITNFLVNQWKAGALVGAKPEEAFSVDVGLGSTMTADDILNGFMNVTIKVALVRPAEFIVITFQQKMQTS